MKQHPFITTYMVAVTIITLAIYAGHGNTITEAGVFFGMALGIMAIVLGLIDHTMSVDKLGETINEQTATIDILRSIVDEKQPPKDE